MTTGNQKSQSGFTLIELMITAVIIGVIAAIAIPNYIKYLKNSRTSEAKLSLSSVYSGEASFLASDGTYTTCLDSVGFSQNTGGKHLYAVGFNVAKATECSGGSCNKQASSPTNCANTEWSQAATTSFTSLSSGLFCFSSSACFAGGNTFTAGACGEAERSEYDCWQVDQTKAVIEITNPLACPGGVSGGWVGTGVIDDGAQPCTP